MTSAAEELCALARARLDGIHGCLDAPTDTPQACTGCRWCASPGTPAAATITRPKDPQDVNYLVCARLADGCEVASNLRECRCGTQLWVTVLMTPLVDSVS
ncbi:MAG: hypothetical protein ACREP9_10785 [Candidatus Dormibacteraceae bacterium]